MPLRCWSIAMSCDILPLLLWASSLAAAERITIEQLQKYHVSYPLCSVALVSHVQNMHLLPPAQKPTSGSKQCPRLYGISQFELVDGTGTVSVETTGSCFPAAMELPGDSDLIELTAKIHAFVPEGRTERVITAIAEHLVVLRPAHMTP